MQLEKEKKEKRERERCRALAQRIAEEANPASAALLGEQMPLLAKACTVQVWRQKSGQRALRQSFWWWQTPRGKRCPRRCPPGCCW